MSVENERALALIADADVEWRSTWNESPLKDRIEALGSLATFVWLTLEDAGLEPDARVRTPRGLEGLLPQSPSPAWALTHHARTQKVLDGQTIRTTFPKTLCLLSEGRVAHTVGRPPEVMLAIRREGDFVEGCVSHLAQGDLTLPLSGAGTIDPEVMLETTAALLGEFARDYGIV